MTTDSQLIAHPLHALSEQNNNIWGRRIVVDLSLQRIQLAKFINRINPEFRYDYEECRKYQIHFVQNICTEEVICLLCKRLDQPMTIKRNAAI